MKRKHYLLLLLCVAFTHFAWAQHEVRLAGHRFVPDQNVQASLRGGALDVGVSTSGQHNVLVQLDRLPSAADIASLSQQGVELGDYVGGNAYFALLKEGAKHPARLRGGVRLTSVMALRPEWKVAPALLGKSVPEHALVGEGLVMVNVAFARNAQEDQVREGLRTVFGVVERIDMRVGTARVRIAQDAIMRMAELPWVLSVLPIDLPHELNNVSGGTLSRARILNAPFERGGRGLLGDGVRVGIWDGNVVSHPDFENRVHVQEYEEEDGASHGTHVAGSVLGAGILDADGRGMAPKAQAWTYNFNVQSNGKSVPQEMYEAIDEFGITLTQNSYGISVARACQFEMYKRLKYGMEDYVLDALSNEHSQVTHVYAAGNDRDACEAESKEMWGEAGYGTGARRAKNIISVGAVSSTGRLTSFSSMGPHDDGRLLPTVCAKGANVWSVQPGTDYDRMSGTSMACPTATGHMALLTERYKQLYHKDVRSDLMRALVANTADEAGRQGPDFMYGYGILNAEHAVECIEKGYFAMSKVALDGKQSHRIGLPAGATGLRVMVVWNDAASSKVYEYGESSLINDLDLVVRTGGTDYLPWVLNPTKGHVTDLAERKVDNLNNIEQVTLSGVELQGMTEVEVEVRGTRVVNGEQDYALVWWIEQPQAMRIVAPLAGDVIAMGRPHVLHVEGMRADYRVEVSADGGKTYHLVGEAPARQTNLVLDLPEDLAPTSAGRLRVVEASTGRSVEVADLVLAPRVQNVKLETSECGYAGWKLKWDAVANAPEGYVVLRYDAKTGGWVKLEEVNATEWNVSAEAAQADAQAIFAVAVKIDASKWGYRSVAAIEIPSRPINGNDLVLPLVEDFSRYPSSILRQGYTGENIALFYRSLGLGRAALPGANTLWMQSKANIDATVADDDLFDPAKNTKNLLELLICEVDLTNAEEDVVFHLAGGLLTGGSDTKSARFRVLDQNVPLASQYTAEPGNVQFPRPSFWHWYFTLKKGEKHSLKIQFASKARRDLFAISTISLEKRVAFPDLQLSLRAEVEGGANLGKQVVKMRALNRGDVDVHNVEVRGYVDGKWQTTQTIAKIGARSDEEFEMELDFTLPGTLGAEMEYKVEILHADDENLNNNTFLSHVNNLGDVYAHPKSTLVQSFFGTYPNDPYARKVVDKPLIYTDHGGVLGVYPTQWQSSTVKFISPEPGMQVRVTFTELDLDEKDELVVYTANVPDKADGTYDPRGVTVRDYLTGHNEPMPRSYVSEAADGSLVISFQTKPRGSVPTAGWVARIDLVPADNAVTLLSVTSYEKGVEAMGAVPVTLRLRNNHPTPVRNVLAYVWNKKDKYYLEEIIDELQPGESEFTFTEKFPLEYGTAKRLQACIESDEDSDASDNTYDFRAVYDNYCPREGKVKSPGELQMSHLTVYRERHTLPYNDGYLMYLSSWASPVYKESKTFDVLMEASKNQVDGPSTFALWVDWDEDGSFDQTGEYYHVEVPKGAKKATVSVAIPDAAAQGMKRMRVMYALPEDAAKPACSDLNIQHGDVRDMSINLLAGADPTLGDIELVAVKPGRSGNNLKPDQPVSIEVRNLSNAPFAGSLSVKMDVDGVDVPVDELDFSAKPLAAGRKGTYKLSASVNLSAHGYHTVTVTIDEKGTEIAKENNTLSAELYCGNPVADGFYALNLRGGNFEKDRILLSEVAEATGNLVMNQSRMVEALFNLDEDQLGIIAFAKGFKVYVTYNYASVEDGSLVVEVGNKIKWTTERVIHPGVWHHVAVSMHSVDGLFEPTNCKVDVYLDGVRLESMKESGAGIAKFNDLYAGRINGKLGLLRMTQYGPKPKNAASINANKYADVTSMEGYIAGFTFNEGPNNEMAFSKEKFLVPIYPAKFLLKDPERVKKEDQDALWEPISKTKLFTDLHFKGQVGPMQWDEESKVYKVKFPLELPDSELQTVEVDRLLTTWHGATIEANSVVTPNLVGMTFDLSGTNKLVIHGKRENVFGHTIEETITIVAARDLSAQGDLTSLTLAKADNPGLLNDIPNLAGNGHMVLSLDAATGMPEDMSKVVCQIEVTPEAKAYYMGQEVVDGKVAVDLRSEAALMVKAPNGAERYFTLRAQVVQTIEDWVTEALSYTYGDVIEPTANPIKATAAPSGLPVTVVSSNPMVASVANGMLYVGKPGVAQLKAVQPGEGFYLPAESLLRTVNVGKKVITVKVDQDAIFGEPIQWKLVYDGLVASSDSYMLPTQLALNAFVFKSKDGKEYQPTDLLPAGEYTAVVKGGAYETELYTITPVEGRLNVVYGEIRMLTFEVTGVEPADMAGLKIKVGRKYYDVNAQGKLSLLVKGGESIEWSVTKTGYSTLTGTFKMPVDADHTVTVPMKKATLTLTYKVDPASTGMGTIVGVLNQLVEQGGNGQQVMAMPAEGKVFAGWSDGIMDVVHQAKNLQANTEVSASFVPVTHTVTYKLGEGVKLRDGLSQDLLKQTVVKGAATTQIEVLVASADYYFIGWSDGTKTMTHSVASVDGDMEITALYGKYGALPVTNDFEQGFTDAWYSEAESGASFVVTNEPLSGWALDGHFAIINSSSAATVASLYTTIYKIDPATDKDITVTFDYKWRRFYDAPTFALEYKLDDEAWVAFTPAMSKSVSQSYVKTQTYTIAKAKLVSKTKLQFRWKYDTQGKKDRHVLIDNVVIYFKDPITHTLTYQVDPADAGIVNDKSNQQISAPVTVAHGSKADPVTAVANEGFKFLGWKETGTTDVTLAIPLPVIENATYTAQFRSNDLLEVSYRALPAAAGSFTVESVPSTSQLVQKGQDSKKILAVANAGYKFLRWEDGSTSAERTVENVQKSMLLSASFVPVEFQVRFVVKADGKPVAQAQVALPNAVLRTNANGVAVTSLEPGQYRYDITAEGYEVVSGTIDVVDADLNYNVDLKALSAGVNTTDVPLTFALTDIRKNPVYNAEVTVEGVGTIRTDLTGIVEFLLPKDTKYSYAIACEGYLPAQGSIQLGATAHKESVVLQDKRPVLSYSATAGGSLEVTVDGEIVATNTDHPYKTEVSIKPVSDQGYYLASLLVDGQECKDKLDAEGMLAITLTEDVEVKATFALVPVKLHFLVTDGTSPLANAEVTVEDQTPLLTNAEGKVELTLEPRRAYTYSVKLAGYETANGSVVLNDEQTVNVSLVKILYQLTYSATEGGRLDVTVNGAEATSGQKYEPAAQVVLKVAAQDGYAPLSLLIDGVERLNDLVEGKLTLSLDAAMSIEAKFVQMFTVTYAAPENGTLTVKAGEKEIATGDKVAKGTTLTLTAAPADNYILASLKVGDAERKDDVNAESHTLDVVVEADLTIAATFEVKPVVEYTVTFAAPENGTLTVKAGEKEIATGDKVAKGTTLTLTVKPADNYTLASLKVGDAERKDDLNAETNSLDVVVEADLTIAATFEAKAPVEYTITYAAPENGTLTVHDGEKPVASGAKVLKGTELTIVAKATQGYRLSSLKVGGTEREADVNVMTDALKVKVEADLTIVATFVKKKPNPVDVTLFADVTAYPNPFVNTLHLQGIANAERVLLLNATGTVVRMETTEGADELTLDLSNLPAGVYLLQVERGEARRIVRVVKQ